MTTTGELRRRLERTRGELRRRRVDGLVVSPGADLRYLCGLDAHLDERLTALVVPADAGPTLIVPELERGAAAESLAGGLDAEIIGWSDTQDPYRLVAASVRGTQIAVSSRMWAGHVFGLQDCGLQPRDGQGIMSTLRAVKSAEEVDALRRAAHAIDAVHGEIDQWLRPGRTENEVAVDLDAAIRAVGHARVDFVIVASGPNGAHPHHLASDRMIEPGDLVVVDIGGTMPDGYCSDSTRTYAAGREPSERGRRVHELVAEAAEAGRRASCPGVPATDVDAAARRVIRDGGFGAEFVHRTGHGIGLDTHEEPYIVEGNASPLADGAVFSVEPGIYLPGELGVRIEDIVAARSAGPDVLTEAPRELRVVG
ncbi:Xaa-Pro peptidase family protein [Blastococcus sp. Marseille-P5729]|uniref:M24 family metallopeptidase n=1 Tax=Blastococcus sp. Marseille-P5729 TaxID=2086582 RepID=UPI000D1044F8|nr:Xaa-Pro peptidase family protein [Blastococcus sp. Marseille-P5729]